MSRCRWSGGRFPGRFLALLLAGALLSACAGGRAFRRGEAAAVQGDWDAAVEYLERALQHDPDNVEYRVAFEQATRSASLFHVSRARAFEADDDLTRALFEYRRASELDPSNGEAAARVGALQREIRDRIEASRPRPPIEEMRAQASREMDRPPPLLEPTEPLNLIEFRNASIRDIIDFIGNATDVNVMYDRDFQDASYTVRLEGVTIEAALDRILGANSYFYKVQGPRSIIVVPDTPQKRVAYEDQVIRTFYISHADAREIEQLLSTVVRVPQMAVQPLIVANPTANTVTIRATTAVAPIIERIIAANDKPRAEVVIDVEILEVNRVRVKQFGLDLSNYSLGLFLSPEVAPENGSVPPFNLNTISQGVSTADFYLSVPQAVVRFLESDSTTRLLANPQLRGREGQELSLNLGADIPIPQTSFAPIAAGGVATNPLTSFGYRPIGVNIEMVPRVTYEGEIIMDLTIENSTVGADRSLGSGVVAPEFGSRRVTTQLRLRDGESNLLAGLIQSEDRRSAQGIPGVIHLPVFRHLLGSTDSTKQETDIVILITPHIVRTHELTQENLSPIHIGPQQNIGLTGPPPVIAPSPGPAAPSPAETPADPATQPEAPAPPQVAPPPQPQPTPPPPPPAPPPVRR